MNKLFDHDLTLNEILIFLNEGHDPNERDANGRNSLYYVSRFNSVKILIEHGANVNNLDNRGYTIIDYLQDDNNIDYLLIEHGAIPGQIDTYIQNKSLFSEDQRKAFDTFLLITHDNKEFYQMCLAFQENIKNNVKMDVKDMEIL
jgi:hypothetical protein